MILHVSQLLHQGTPSQPGEIGTADPSVWGHRLYHNGHIYQAVLKSDVIHSTPDYSALLDHYSRHPEMWTRLIPNKPIPQQ